jgi:3-methyladenine DNA glycosylase AlkD
MSLTCEESIKQRICVTCEKKCKEKEGFIHSSYGWCCGMECYKTQLAERTELIRQSIWGVQKI